ncbi:MAG: hypothetical protein DRH20_11035, partial [Deltaproteobacteria bacterium]
AMLVRDAEFYRLPRGLERAEFPVFALVGDYNLSLGQMLPIMCCFDYFFCDSKGVRIFRKLGFQNCEFLCLYGFDPELHRDYGLEKMWDVAFVGNLNHAIQQERESHLFRLARLADTYRVHIDTGIFGTEYARVLNQAHLVFNLPIRDEANMRFFEAMACGAVVMNPPSEELELLGFRADRHYLAFKDPEEALERYFHQWGEDRRVEIARNAREVLEHHTYDRRAADLLKAMERIPVDPRNRPALALDAGEMDARWEQYFAEEVDVEGLGKVSRFHPTLVAWQRHLVKHELDIRNLDFHMWAWWIRLLALSGLKEALARFLADRENLLQVFPCYHDKAEELRASLNQLLYGFHFS